MDRVTGDLLASWRQGVAEFNEGRYWDAHESWERGWKHLPEPQRTWVQAWIQVAAALHLEPRPERAEAVRALRSAAESKLARVRAEMATITPRIEVTPDPLTGSGRLRARLEMGGS